MDRLTIWCSSTPQKGVKVFAHDVLDRLSKNKKFDPELWDFVESRQGRRLINLSEKELQIRLLSIEKNICYLDPTPVSRIALPPERGWISPWYWARLRHWTISELERRGAKRPAAQNFKELPEIRREFHGILRGGRKILTRVSRIHWLKDILMYGRIRFAPASSYIEIEGDAARTDDELVRQTYTPGNLITIAHADGTEIPITGDLTRYYSRKSDASYPTLDYWLSSFSTDFDPRLIAEFPSAERDDAILVIFDALEFANRCADMLDKVAPHSEKLLGQIQYYDPYHPSQNKLEVRASKDIRFAYQREWRLMIDPNGFEVPKNEGSLFVEIGSLTDIAGIYDSNGSLICGSGPITYRET